MKDVAPQSELLVIAEVFEIAGRLLVVSPDFAVPDAGWQSCSVPATVVMPNGEHLDWPLALELAHSSIRPLPNGPGVPWRVVPCFRGLAKDAVPVGSRVFVGSEAAQRLTAKTN